MNHRIARTGTCKAVLILAILFSATAFADFPTISGKSPNQVDRWSAHGGVSSFRFNYGLLNALEISIQGPARPAGSEMPGEIEFQIHEDSQLEVWAPHGAWDGFAAGGFKHAGNFLIRWPGGMLESDGLTIRPAAPDVLEVVDDSGNALFRLDYIHTMLHLDTPLMTLRNMDIRLTPWLAQRISHGELANLSIGGAFIHAPLDIPAGAPDGNVVCGPPNWDDGGYFYTDVELTNLAGIQEVARETGVRVAIAPAATLRNVGRADVPWYEKFDTPAGGTYPPPYGRDQHPFLVWAMYRIVDDIPQQIGQSAVKHAFFSTNTTCDCQGGNILWSGESSPDGLGCMDTYSVNNNNSPVHLGVRGEVPAFTGEWEQCGSMFAPGEVPPGPCNQSNTGDTSDLFERRLVVEEDELTTVDATYYFEGWYVIRDDIDIFNTMAHVSVTPTPPGAMWTFPSDPSQGGPAINAWVAPGTMDSDQAHTVEVTDDGHYSLAVKVTDIGGGMFRYVYALMNYDFDPKFNALAVPLPAGVNIVNIQYLDGDSDGTNDWNSSVNGGELAWTAPDSASALEWGFMATFVFEADQAPIKGVVELTAEEEALSFSPLVLGLTDTFYREGFED